jgi:hypothetical protein
MEEKNEFVPIEEFLTPELKVYYDELLGKGFEVMVLRKYGYEGPWKIREVCPFHIVMPWNDVANKSLFAHELLHIYFDFVKGMSIPISSQIIMTTPYHLPQGEFLNQHTLNSIINNLQHYKMLPLYLECGFEADKFVGNYYEFSDIEKAINGLLNLEVSDNLSSFQKYSLALNVADFICLEKFNVNPEHKNLMQEVYAPKVQEKFPYLSQQLTPIIDTWQNDDNIKLLVDKINQVAKDYAL